jgi:hypothetical protein
MAWLLARSKELPVPIVEPQRQSGCNGENISCLPLLIHHLPSLYSSHVLNDLTQHTTGRVILFE